MVGDILKYLRLCNDLSIEEVAKKMGTSSSYISDVEKSRRNISLPTLKKFAECYDIEVHKIISYVELKESGMDRIHILIDMLKYYLEKEKFFPKTAKNQVTKGIIEKIYRTKV